MTNRTMPLDKNPQTGHPFYEDCDICNYGGHSCGGCGKILGHNGRLSTGKPHKILSEWCTAQ